ncbi:hypothetical protein OAT67_00760 [Bacteriovoracaceae bacterium]|nr:hypothetical protein [Bacteriovoracaceae bacterium]
MNKKINILTLLLLISTMTFATSSNKNHIIFYVHGGAMKSYTDDTITINPQGDISLSKISPTFAKYPNTIGQFEYQISKDDLSKLQMLITTKRKNIKHHQPRGGAIVEELHIGNDKIFWTSRDQSDSIKAIRSEFLKLAKQAYKNPVKAMSLECSQDKTQIKCAYKNVSKETVDTVDPLGVSYSVSCLDIRGKKKVLHELKEYNPKKMTPKKIKIKPNEEYKFSIKTSHVCDYRVVVKTTDMMINKNYKDVLLGELVSNQITK